MNPPAHYVVQGDCLAVLKTFPDASISAVVTDPPYGLSKEPDMAEVVRHWCAAELRAHAEKVLGAAAALALFPSETYTHGGSGFMGKSWDSFVPGPEVWREVLRVLKPGGHVLVFSGTRTYDLTVLAMRIAGFEIRDQLAWLYGSGFPKSLDVSKAIDASERGAMVRAKLLHFAATRGVDGRWLESRGVASAASFADWTTGGHVPGEKNWQIVKVALGVTDDEEQAFAREVIGAAHRKATGRAEQGAGGYAFGEDFDVTAPATPEAQQWSGWGTALKPAQEPIVLARKPLVGTVAANVLAHGTGAINVDGCRIDGAAICAVDPVTGEPIVRDGRWPANVIMDDVAAAALDEQTGAVKGQQGRAKTDGSEQTRTVYSGGRNYRSGDPEPRGDTGGASRFFYCAKTSRAEREAGLDHLPAHKPAEITGRAEGSAGQKHARSGMPGGEPRRNIHPTVKPIALMRWLVRLITPPGGIVLDPYCGSGSTLCAAVLEGVTSVGIELTPDYIPIIEGRVEHWKQHREDAEP